MTTQDWMTFIKGLQDLNGPALLTALPQMSVPYLKAVCQEWLSGKLGTIDPTNVLCGGDYAEQFLSLPAHAAVMYDAALEYMHRHPESIANDTDCAAASLNLVDLLDKAGQHGAATAAANRAARMPVKRPEQNVQLAVAVSKGGDMVTAYSLFKRAESAGLGSVAQAMGVSMSDLNQMGTFLARAAAGGRSFR